MKNIKYFCGMLFLSFFLVMQITSCGGGDDAAPAPTPGTPFITSDLAGTWYMFATNGASVGVPTAGSITAGNLRGTLILDSLGQVVLGGSYTRSPNGSASITGGLIGIDNSGLLSSGSSSFTTNLGVNFYLGSGQMDSTKNVLSFVTSTNYGEYDFITAIRTTGGFSSLDLAATWHVFGAGGAYGKITVSDAGNGTRATIASPGGGGFFAIDGNGLLNTGITGTSYVVTGSIPPNLYLAQGKINLSKDIMFFVASTDSLQYDLAMAIRAGGTFSPADLSGTWRIYGASSSAIDSTDKDTLSGTVTINSAGNVTGGSYTRSDGGKASLTGGTVTIDNAGVLGGSATTNTGDNIAFASGKMNAAKGMMSLVGVTAIGGEQVSLFCIKVN